MTSKELDSNSNIARQAVYAFRYVEFLTNLQRWVVAVCFFILEKSRIQWHRKARRGEPGYVFKEGPVAMIQAVYYPTPHFSFKEPSCDLPVLALGTVTGTEEIKGLLFEIQAGDPPQN